MATTENRTTCDTLRSTTATTISSSKPEMQNYIGVWLDSNCKQNAYAPIKQALHSIFNSLAIFSRFDECTMYINQHRPAKIFFIVSHGIGQNLVPLMLDENTSAIEYVYIYCTNLEEQKCWHSDKYDKIRGGYIAIEPLIQQIKNDISTFDERMKATMLTTTLLITPPETKFDNSSIKTVFDSEPIYHPTFYAVPSTLVLDEDIKNTSIKDLSKDYVWFIQFQLLVEILIRLTHSEQAKTDIISICQKYYENDDCEQRKIEKFADEADDLSKIIYWYTAESFLIHLLNRVCGTEDVDHLYYFRLIISNLHKRIVQLENDTVTINLKKTRTILYRGKRMGASTLENFRKSIGSMVVMKGFLSTTVDENVATVFAGAGIEQTGSVCVLFKLNIDNWKQCNPSAAIKPKDGAMQDEDEVLFSIGSIWKINNVNEIPGARMWLIELTSCPESNALSTELPKYLKEQLGETSNLCTLGDFLMKIGEYKKAEKYYNILKNDLNLPEQHVDRARIYNRLGIIRREQNELNLAIDYFKKAVNAAPPDSNIVTMAINNIQVTQKELKRAPEVFLGKRLASSDVISKSLVTNEISTPIWENNSGHAAYHEREYDKAIKHYEKALSIMGESKFTYLHEISCVYNNLGAVEYDKKNYSKAKEYFQEAIFTLQQFTPNHPWIIEYKKNLACAQQKFSKRQMIE